MLDAEGRLDKAEVSIVNQIAVYGRTLHCKKPKSESGNGEVILDPDTVAVFRRYKADAPSGNSRPARSGRTRARSCR